MLVETGLEAEERSDGTEGGGDWVAPGAEEGSDKTEEGMTGWSQGLTKGVTEQKKG